MTDRTHPDSGRIITSSDILLHDAETALMYEEIRAAIDDGHESMTHAGALAEIAAIRAENTELRSQIAAIGAGGVQALSAGPGASRAAPPSTYVNGAGIHAEDGASAVIRKLDARFHDIVTFKVADAAAASPTPPAEQQAAPKAAPREPFQHRVQPWLLQCFGAEIAADTVERNHRFLEEALELVQSTGCTQSEAHQLVDYVFGRPVGEPAQEVGGVMVTLAALCLANGLDMHNAGEIELARIWTKVEAIRAKQAAKPKHLPLPQAAPQQEAQEPAAYIHVPHHTVEGQVRPVVSFEKYQQDYADGIYSTRIPLYTAPQPAPAPLSEMPYEKRKAIQEGEQIGASDAWFKARHEMLDTVDRRNVFRAGFDRGWNAALAAQGGKP